MADLAQLEEQIVSLSLLEAAELVKKLEERLGVSAAAAAPVVVAGGAGAAAAPAAEEKTEFQVILKDAGREQDQHHQGCPRSHFAGSQGSQGTWSMALPRPSRKAQPRKKLRPSRRSSKAWPRSRSSSSRSTRFASPERTRYYKSCASFRPVTGFSRNRLDLETDSGAVFRDVLRVSRRNSVLPERAKRSGSGRKRRIQTLCGQRV